MKPTTEERLRRAAAAAVEAHPGIEAVVLFGSRARGAARPRSDWDVAILVHAGAVEERAARTALRGLAGVDEIVLTPGAIREHRNHAGRVEAAVAREGRLLAGAWTRPRCRKEDLDVEPEEFKEGLTVAVRDLRGAVTALCDAAIDGADYVANVVELSQQAAEAVAKNVVAGFGLSPAEVHDLRALADQLASAYRGRRREREEREFFADAIRGLNGGTRAAHAARYARAPVEDPSRTVDRLVRTLALQGGWLRWYAGRCPEVRDAAREVGGRIAAAGRRLERQEGFDRLPEALREAVTAWKEDGASIA